MKISVIIPSFNHGKYIVKALESVIQQSHPVDEILVVDDASTDDTCQIIKDKFPNVRLLINKTNQGPSYSRNYGIESSTGDFITFLDADDLWPKDKIEWQYNYLINNTNIKMVAGYVDCFFSEKTPKNNIRRTYLEGKPHFNAYLSAFLIWRSVFDDVGMFDVKMRLSEDQDWYMRTKEANISLFIKEKISLKVRIHDTNISGNLSFKDSGFIQALRNSINRREKLNINT
jgi:glycosyltransferase involved in cell wall biosynthesis